MPERSRPGADRLTAPELIEKYRNRMVVDQDGFRFHVRHISSRGAELVPLNGDDGTLSKPRGITLDNLRTFYSLSDHSGSVDRTEKPQVVDGGNGKEVKEVLSEESHVLQRAEDIAAQIRQRPFGFDPELMN
jgi:hypothetical protein